MGYNVISINLSDIIVSVNKHINHINIQVCYIYIYIIYCNYLYIQLRGTRYHNLFWKLYTIKSFSPLIFNALISLTVDNTPSLLIFILTILVGRAFSSVTRQQHRPRFHQNTTQTRAQILPHQCNAIFNVMFFSYNKTSTSVICFTFMWNATEIFL